MSEETNDLSRRSVLKAAAVGGVGLAAGASLLGACVSDTNSASAAAVVPQAVLDENAAWFAKRVQTLSGNKVLKASDGSSRPTTTLARRVYFPKSAQEIADLIKSTAATTPIACVCGGHESSNAATIAGSGAIILDLHHLKSIEFHQDAEGMLVTVGAGVVFRELVEAVKEKHGALPVGTGPGVGVVGYIVNGGLSGYFSRRLGLLGQRVEKLTMVTAAGEIRVLTRSDELLTVMMGAGSALGVVVDVTIRVADESILQSAEQRVFVFETRSQAVEFSRGALRILREHVLSDDSVTMELVVTGTKALVVTVVFYDSFQGNAVEFVKRFEDLAASAKLPMVAQSHWSSWYETAAALWPVINGITGDPLVMLFHSVGTKGIPLDSALDFVSDTMVANAPLDEAGFSLVEIRALGGATLKGPRLPTGNCHHAFFVDLISMYDAKNKTVEERQAIVDRTNSVMATARTVDGLSVDLSGTHSQPDDVGASAVASVIFGTQASADSVTAMKKRMDPSNRFRFHPFAKFV